MSLPDVWMITIENNLKSRYYRSRTKRTWERQGFKVRIYPAVTPDLLSRQQNRLKFDKVKRSGKNKREFTETEKAVWYSHYNLWRFSYTYKIPIIVAEHDAMLTGKIEENYFDNKILGMSHQKGNNNIMRYAAGVAYYITPEVSKDLIAVNNLIIDFNSDAWIHKKIDNHGVWKKDLVQHFRNTKVGFTIEHQ